MAAERTPLKRIFSYEEAAAMLPRVAKMTDEAVAEVEALLESQEEGEEEPPGLDEQYQAIVSKWAESVMRLGIEVKGLWLIDFDNGSGYYCWRHPEPALQYFHGYEDGFGGRVQLN